VIAILLVIAFTEFDLDRTATDDDGILGVPGGTLLLTQPFGGRPTTDHIDALFLMLTPAFSKDRLKMQLVRLVGLPGETVEVDGVRVRVGGRVLPMPPSAIHAPWPDTIGEDSCLVLTDHPQSRCVDSRMLGEIPIPALRKRVVAPLSLF